MRFLYAYKTRDNARHEGAIHAANKEAAYSELKARGIKPIRVDEAPGFFNKLFGKGKRWIAIVMLATVAAVAVSYALRMKRSAIPQDTEDRSQLYGDPAVIQAASENGWAATFPDAGDAWLARHAVPGAKCDCGERGAELKAIEAALVDGRRRKIAIADDDFEEVAKVKRMVNGMKAELDAYLNAGGSTSKYMDRVDIRQRAEAGFVENARYELRKCTDQAKWKRRNAELRAMGLPMIVEDEK